MSCPERSSQLSVQRYADSDSKLTEVVKLIFDTTVANREYSILGCGVCKYIHEKTGDKFGSEFLQKLLQHFQSEIKCMKEIRSKSIEHWLGIFGFLCDMYHTIKISGNPIKVIGKSIIQNIEKMLNDPDTIDDEIDVICSKLKACGKYLEEQHPDLIENIFVTFRQQVISSKSSCQRRCLIMELIELKGMGWVDQTSDINRFYADALADAITEDEIGF